MQVDASSSNSVSLVELLRKRAAGQKDTPQASMGSGNCAAAAGFATMVVQMCTEVPDTMGTAATGAATESADITEANATAAVPPVTEANPRDLFRLLESGGGGGSLAGGSANQENFLTEFMKSYSDADRANSPTDFAEHMQKMARSAYGV